MIYYLSCAKKPKVTAFDNKAIGDTRLSKLIARISEGDEHTKLQLTKEAIVSPMDFVTAQCIAKLACVAAAEEEDNCMNATENNVHNGDRENADEPNVPNEPNELNEPNETNNHTYCYMNSSINIAKQALELPNSHAVVSRSYFSQPIESDKCLRKLKATIVKAKQYRSSHPGQRFYTAALIQASCKSLNAGEQVIPLIVAAFLVDAGIAFDPKAVATSCPSAKTLNSFIVDGSIYSVLWLEQSRDADAVFIACDKGNRKGIDHSPKVLSWWSKKKGEANESGGKSEQCAVAICHSIKMLRNAIT
jgi:hypothetical protein